MRIVATTLLGPGCGPKLPGAFDSVRDLVDAYVVVESGGGGDALQAAYDAAGAVPVVPVSRYVWDANYGRARQHALDMAASEAGADWALTLDPDERVSLGDPATVRAGIEAHPEVVVWEAKHALENYPKERLISCHAEGEWVGRSCEYYERIGKTGMAGTFDELPHDEAHMVDRFERGVANMKLEMQEHPDDPRWPRHMAACLSGLGQKEEALHYMQQARDLFAAQGYPEQASWSEFQIAELFVGLERLDDAFDEASRGLARHAGLLPEHGSVLAFVEYRRSFDEERSKAVRREHLQNAARWSQLVIGCPDDKTRRWFKSPHCRHNATEVFRSIYPERAVPVAFGKRAPIAAE